MAIELEDSPKTVDNDEQLLQEINLGKKIVVDAALWHRLVYLIMTHPEQLVTGAYTPQARVLLLGRVRGGQNASSQMCQAFWEDSKNTITPR